MSAVLGSRPLFRKLFTAASIAALLAVAAPPHLLLLGLPTQVCEATDFLGYWAAARLFAHGENPYDQDALLALQRDQGWAGTDPMYSWNPPWLHLILLPLGLLSFRQAAALWFVVNPLPIGLSALLILDVVGRRTGAAQVALVLLAAFLYSRSLHAMLGGQVNTLVLVGGAAFLSLALRRGHLLAGAVRLLVTVKPHLSYLLLPAVVAASIRGRRWGILASSGASVIVLVFVVTLLFPAWPAAYRSLFQVAASPLEPARYVTPTVRGFLLANIYLNTGAVLIVFCLASFLIRTALRGHDLSLPTVASLWWIVGLRNAPVRLVNRSDSGASPHHSNGESGAGVGPTAAADGSSCIGLRLRLCFADVVRRPPRRGLLGGTADDRDSVGIHPLAGLRQISARGACSS